MSPVSPRRRALARHGDPKSLRHSLRARPAPIPIKVKVDPRRRARFESLLAEMSSSKKDESIGFDAYWEAVGEILDGELFVAGGYESADAFVKEVVKESKRTVQRMVRVAKYATPAQEAKYGTTLLDAAITYVEALTSGPTSGPVKVDFDALRIPVDRDGKTVRRPLAELSAEEVAATARAHARKGGAARARSSPAEQAIVEALSTHPPLARVSVRVTGGMLRLGAIPLAALGRLASILAKVDVAGGATTARPTTRKRPAKTAKAAKR